MKTLCCQRRALLLLLANYLLLVESVQYSRTIYIDPLTGEDDTACLQDSAPTPCQNITWVFQQAHSDSTHYVLSGGEHYLTNTTPSFKDLTSLAITGDNSVVTCSEEGLAFINVANLMLNGVTFSQCAALRNSTSKNFTTNTISEFKVALYFYLCENVNMSHVTVEHSPHATGVVMYDANGTNTITHSNFSNNIVPSANRTSPGGGGFYVEFTYCEPGVLPCDTPTGERRRGGTFSFESCFFGSNRADNTDTEIFSTYIIPYRSDHEAFGRGGGLSLFVKGDTSEIEFSVSNCTFEDNVALWGGGLFVEFHDNSHSNKIYVSDCMFLRNRCLYSVSQGTEGGGLRVGHYVYGLNGDTLPVDATGNSVRVERSHFADNSALHGGGLSVSIALQQANQTQLAIVDLVENTFECNTAKLGSAVNFDRFGSIMKGLMGNMQVRSCNFSKNSIQYAEKIGAGNSPYQMGIGTIHIDEVPVWFSGSMVLALNNGSAISAIGTMINFTDCRAVFQENRGSNGAGIALLGAAYIIISNSTRMNFDRNKASDEGGAIYNVYTSRETLKSDSNCFIRHTDPFLHPDDWGAVFIFSYNTNRKGHPNAIHSTSIFPCALPGGSGLTNGMSRIFCWDNWRYSPNIIYCNATKQITSDIGSLEFEDDEYITVHSGWMFPLPVTLHDDLNNTIEEASFAVTYNDTNDANVYRKDSVVVRGEPETAVHLSIDSLGDRIWHFDLIVNLMPCPAGFRITHVSFPGNDSIDQTNTSLASSEQCVCSDSYGGVVLCDDTSKTIKILSGMWIGKLDPSDDEYIVMDCPLHYCESGIGTHNIYITVDYNERKDVDWDEEICGPKNRTGINCGQCRSGTGLAVNSLSYECIDCTDVNIAANTVAYVASVYLPLAALFIILIMFDVRLTTGPANAFILYCQVVTSTFDLTADGGIPSVSKTERILWYVYRLPFGVFNLKFIESVIPPICFTTDPRFNTLSVLMLDYMVALFPLLMIIVVVLCLKFSENCCKCLGVQHRRRMLSISRLASVLSAKNRKKKVNDALLPAFASFVLLSYTKFSTTSAYILTTQNPITQTGDRLQPDRIYFASQFTTSSAHYLLYYIPALLVFVTIVPLTPLILLDYPLKVLELGIAKVKILRRMYPNDKVHLFLNMFQGCYRQRMRFFAGLYFVFRFVTNLTYIVTDTWLQQFVVQQTATTIMIALLAICQPYEWRILNYVDILIFTNMAILNSVSFYLYSFVKINPLLDPSLSAIVIQYLLVFMPLVYMVAYVIWNISRRHHGRIKKLYQKLFKPKGYEPLEDEPVEKELPPRIQGRKPRMSFVGKKDFEDDFEAMLSRAEDQNTYVPSLSKSVTVVEVSGKHSEGEATTFQAPSESADFGSSQPSPGSRRNYGGTAIN